MKPLIIAHRGASSYAIENTINSFQKAIDLGADMIELDVWMSKDRHLVVIHDSTIDRLTAGSGLVRYFRLKDLKKIRLRGSEVIPTLSEVVEKFSGQVKFNIELKKIPEGVDKLFEILDKYDLREKVLISSFSRRVLERVKELGKEVCSALLSWKVNSRQLRFALESRIEFIHPYFYFLTKKQALKIRKLGFGLNVWTINFKQDMRRALKWGVDGIITNRPDVARKLIYGKI